MINYLPEEEDDVLRVCEQAASWATGYRELKVYRYAHELGVAARCLSLRLPKYELYETGSQLHRAAKAISANIVEGYGRRRYKADFVRFLIYAKSSLDETEEHIQYILDCHSETEEATTLLQKADELGRKLHRFINTVESSHLT